jgi:hypothetical protein
MSSEYSNIYDKNNGGNKSAGFTTKTIHFGTVKSYERVGNIVALKVRVNGLDNHLVDENLSIAYPFIPIHVVMTPKIGEVVRIILSDVSNPYEDRLWVGPVITDYFNTEGQAFPIGNRMTLDEAGLGELFKQPHAGTLNDIDDAIPNHSRKQDDAIYFLGRGNVDFFFKGNTATIRAGKQDPTDKKKKNRINPASITVHHSKDGKLSCNYMIADSIALISHKGNPLVPQARNGVMTDEEFNRVNETLHPIGKGDVIADVLGLIIQVLCEDHVHPYAGHPAVESALVKKLKSYDLNNILSTNIKIN